jgi:ubiquinone/menaquinone biosynthesis C-methylase UbiE
MIEKAVVERYAKGAQVKEAALCCPVTYDRRYLKVLPAEILQKDYGCGDPSQYVKEGETVLDLGSGAGKICYIASQIVGPKGKVIGIDFNPTMLALAKKYQKEISQRIGWNNVEFHWAKIQDLKTDLSLLEANLQRKPVRSVNNLIEFENLRDQLRHRTPLIANESIDVILSNCVLNLIRPEDKANLFKEMHRVLKKGGRVAISDIVSDEFVPEKLRNDLNLWSGCISGAFQEKEFIKAFEDAGFYGIKIDKLDQNPWQTVEGIEFRSVTITAYKGKEGPCFERNQAIIYKGPWKQVEDDDKHVLRRGVRTAVCDKTFQILSNAPYKDEIIFIEPLKEIPLAKAKPFDCSRTTERHPKESKGMKYKITTNTNSVCMEGGCC